jgi:nucleoside phosphorylase
VRHIGRPALLGALLLLAACGDGDDDDAPSRIAVLSAFPAELEPLLVRTDVSETVVVDGRILRLGTMSGRPVVVAMTGIGLVNAAATTRAVLTHLPVRGVVVSGVAGSPLRIADVVAAATWSLDDGSAYAAHPPWLALAHHLAERGLELARCTSVAGALPDPVCMVHRPALFVGGAGHSADPFGAAFPCRPGAGDVFGCDVGERPGAAALSGAADGGGEELRAEDMETAAIAREAAAFGVPFIAFRAVSDGAGDPLDLPGFPQQFYAYYRLAADNAAAVAAAFIGRLEMAGR